MSVKYKLTLGADPEMTLFNTKSKKFESAHTYVPGTKSSPVIVPGGAVQLDGTGAEFNINPARNRDEFINNIKGVLTHLNNMVQRQNPDLVLLASPTATFDPGYFALLPDACKERGCDPDFDAWRDGQPNEKPGGNEPVRTYGGHVHVGFTEHADIRAQAHIYDCITVTKQLDVALFVPSLLFDDDEERRKQYGMMGTFRPQPHGCEYRPLSNVWVGSPDLVGWVYDSTIEAMAMLANEEEDGYNHLWQLPQFRDDILAIRAGRKPTRKELMNLHDDLVNIGFPSLPERFLHA